MAPTFGFFTFDAMRASARFLFVAGVLMLPLLVGAWTKHVTVAGGEKIKIELKHGMPVPAKADGIQIEAAAFGTAPDGLAYGFGFTCATPKQVSHVTVENVTGRVAEVLVNDAAPHFEDGSWFEKAKPLPITPAAVPWLFEAGDTTLVFRFTVTRGDKKTVLYQAAVFPADTKAMVRRAASVAK